MLQPLNSSSKQTNVLFIGAYGIENAGDDLPMLAMIDNLKKLSPDKNFSFHALTRHLSDWEKTNYPVIFHQNLEYESREQAKGKWLRGLNFDDDRQIFEEFTQLIKSMDILIIGAGNFIIDICIDIFKGPIPLNWWYVHLAKLYSKKVFLYGFSTAPLSSEYGQLLAKEIVNRSDIVTVRDTDSEQYLRSLGIEKPISVLPDPTLSVAFNNIDFDFLKKVDQCLTEKHSSLTIAIGVRSLNFLGEQGHSILQTLTRFIDKSPQYRYIFVPQSTYFEDDDIALAEKMLENINHSKNIHIIKTRYTPKQLISLYSLADITIAVRLHSAVFSQIAGTPAIAINYLPKVASYMKDFGTSEQCIEMNDFSLLSINKCINNIQGNPDLIDFIEKQHTIKNEQAKKYAQLVLKLLQNEGN